MAKDFKVKFFVDSSGAVREIEGALTSAKDFETQIASLQKKLNESDYGSEQFKQVEKELKRTVKAAEQAKNANKSWLEVMAGAPGIVGQLGQSIQGAGKLFGNFNMLLKTSLIGFVASAVVQLVQQFSKMEGIMDPLNKITSVFSGLMSQLANVVLKPMTFTLELVAKGLEKLGNLFGGAGDELGNLAERQDELNDSQADYELGLAKSNRALAEAREKSQDATLSVKERKQALQDADKLEREIAAEGKKRALEQARILANQLAVTLGYSQEQIDAIKKYDAAQLESFTKEIAQKKGLNQEQRTQLLQQIATIQEIDAQTAKQGKKTASQIRSIENEGVQAAKEAAQKKLENQKKGLEAAIELEKNKANTDEKILRKLLEDKDKLENQELLKEQKRLQDRGKKQTEADKQRLQDIKNILEVQKQNREKAIQSEVKTDTDAAKKLEDDKLKIQQQGIKNRLDQKNIELEQIKLKYGEDSEAYKKAQLDIYAEREKNLKSEKDALEAKKELTAEEKQRLEEIRLESGKLANEVLATNQKEIQSQLEKNNALAAAREVATNLELEASGTTFERKMEILTEQQSKLDEKDKEKRDKLKADLDAKIIDQTTYDAKIQELDNNAVKNKKANEDAKSKIEKDRFNQQMEQAQKYADAANALADLAGKDTVAGKALAIAGALISTYKGAASALEQPFPFNLVALATTIATGLKTVREITSVKVPTEQVPEVRIRKQMGGVLQGPTHAMGGIATNMGELEGGEYVINRASTMMYRPTLDRINALGGGNVDYQAQGFAPNAGGGGEAPIFKTYVVASDMSSQQELDRVIKDRSKF